MEHDDLDKVLNERHCEAPRDGLAEDIIALAVQKPKVATGSFWQRTFVEFQASFALPHPVMTLAFILFVGMLLGFEAEALAALSQEDMSSFLYIDEEWL